MIDRTINGPPQRGPAQSVERNFHSNLSALSACSKQALYISGSNIVDLPTAAACIRVATPSF